jgi:hypothetical protein
MTTVDNHHIVNSHSSVGAIQVTDNGSSIKQSDAKVVVDEEIDSCEGEDYDEKMFQVALVNSVMDTGGNGNGIDEAPEQAPGEMSPRSKARYALRKRRRPGDEATAAAPLASDALELPNDPLNELQHVQDNGAASISMPPIHLPPPTPIHIQQEPPQHRPVPAPTQSTIPQQQQHIGITARGHSPPGTISKPPSSSPAFLPSITSIAPQQRRSNEIAPMSSIKTNNIAFSGKPTNIKKKASRKRKVKPPKVTAKTKVAERLSIPVPNPLLAITSPTHQSLNHSVLRGRQDTVASTSLVPCPLSVPSPLDAVSSIGVMPFKKITTSYMPPFDPSKLTTMGHPVQNRTRVFSVDLDRKFCVL